MKRRLFVLAVLIAAAVLLLAIRPAQETSESPPAKAAGHAAAQPIGAPDDMLFPQMNVRGVTFVSVTTPTSRFEFRRSPENAVSVNGQQGDPGVFATLLEQIAAIEGEPIDAFLSPGVPLMTLVVCEDGEELTVEFYDDHTDETARLLARCGENQKYARTDGWRIGTLLLACEGTRIQDERGNELPAP